MKILIIISISFLSLLPHYDPSYSQTITGCGTQTFPGETPNPGTFFGGKYKPNRSDIGNPLPADEYFPILVVFVQFDDEPELISTDINAWPSGQPPNYIDQVVAPDRIVNSEWWEAYNGFDVSDYWHEFSRGKLHVRGRVESIVLPQPINWYRDNGGIGKVNFDIYNILSQRLQSEWEIFDNWKYLGDGEFSPTPDGLVDMIYMVYRRHRYFLSGYDGGAAILGACENAVNNQYTVTRAGPLKIL